MKIKTLILTAVMVIAGSTMAVAQNNIDSHTVTMTVAEVAWLRIFDPGAKNITLTLNQPVGPIAGNPVASASIDTLYLQYTVVTSVDKRITVAADANTWPAGTQLQVTATPAAATNQGTSTGLKVISNAAQDVVIDIRSCHTGIVFPNGANLLYTLAITNATLLTEETVVRTITYTLVDE